MWQPWLLKIQIFSTQAASYFLQKKRKLQPLDLLRQRTKNYHLPESKKEACNEVYGWLFTKNAKVKRKSFYHFGTWALIFAVWVHTGLRVIAPNKQLRCSQLLLPGHACQLNQKRNYSYNQHSPHKPFDNGTPLHYSVPDGV